MKIGVQSCRNLILLYLASHFTSSIFTQVEIDKPILELKENCTLRCIVDVDSSNWIYTSINVKSVDMYNDRKPGEYSVNIYQRTPHKYQFYFVIQPIDSVIISQSGTIPNSCIYYIHRPKTNIDSQKQVKYKKKSHGYVKGAIYSPPDSIPRWKDSCLYEFYKQKNDSIISRTFLSKLPISAKKHHQIKIWSCQYFYDMKHGKEIRYYDLNDLKQINLNGEYPGLMFVGNWKYGLKHGLWQYFDKSGNLIRVEKYRYGKLIKSDTRKLLKKEANIKTEY